MFEAWNDYSGRLFADLACDMYFYLRIKNVRVAAGADEKLFIKKKKKKKKEKKSTMIFESLVKREFREGF